jgi:hypothetical protein
MSNKSIKVVMDSKPEFNLIKDIITINGEHIPATYASISCDPGGMDTLTIVIPVYRIEFVYDE